MIRRTWRRLVAYVPIWQCVCGELARRGRWCASCTASIEAVEADLRRGSYRIGHE